MDSQTPLTAEALRGLRQLANKVDPGLGILSVADSSQSLITFAYNTEKFFGYADQELIGKSFKELLPTSAKRNCKELLQTLVRQPLKYSLLSVLPKAALEESLVGVSVSFHPSENPGSSYGLFLFLIQSQDKIHKKNPLLKLKLDFNSIASASDDLKKKARRAIALQITLKGGVVGFIAWVLTQITPLGTALKGAIAAWNFAADNPSAITDKSGIEVRSVISDRQRFQNTVLIRNQLNEELQGKVVAVSYFILIEEGRQSNLHYITDSSAPPGAKIGNQAVKEIWFYSLTLTPEERQSLDDFDCLLKRNGAYPPEHINPKGNQLDVILCPVTKPTQQSGGLYKFVLSGVIGMALLPGSIPSGESPEIEPYAGKLWKYAPNF